MATDPTKQIRRRRFTSPFALGADNLLDRIAHLEPATDVPYLTVALDWTVEGSSPGRQEPEEVQRSQSRSGWQEGDRWRPSVEVLERELNRLIDEHGPRGEIFDSLNEDKEKIEEFLRNMLAQEAQGVWIIANASRGVFEATGLAMPVDTEIRLRATPGLYGLVRLIEDNPLYGVLHADQHDATLSFIARGLVSRQSQLLSSEWPRKQQQGGWSQRRFQARADERVEAFARDIAEETHKALDLLGVETLIVAGSEVITSALDAAFHDSVKERIAETIRLEMVASEQEMIEATLPIAEEAERTRETAAVERLQERVGSGERGAAGMADTLRALQNGQADEVIVADTFEGAGWADYDMHVFGVGNLPTQHPLGGDVADIVEIDLREEFVRLALATDADVEVIHSDVPVPESGDIPDAGEERPVTEAAGALTDLGGVGATLRFDLQETAPDQSV
jgi:hypothetical protein